MPPEAAGTGRLSPAGRKARAHEGRRLPRLRGAAARGEKRGPCEPAPSPDAGPLSDTGSHPGSGPPAASGPSADVGVTMYVVGFGDASPCDPSEPAVGAVRIVSTCGGWGSCGA
ncbi:hypothetical protein H114_18416 [Streptomyces gancidicus BKS 13-15]|uniref:Uncharacterized protein n=2 Tax=Streptomyces pseudogriseolus TaxID=36817 RepID=M3E191_STREZ|nr:hypothetical protein H114_18416 [Streptomyces gancidicus BKS 13-15]GGS34610.1 hypothetical protein GCM10010285_12080 [Streptomyces rubiginosus]